MDKEEILQRLLAPEIELLVVTYLQAKAFYETIAQVVKNYESEILIELNAVDELTNEPVTESKKSYRVDDDTYQKFRSRCDEEAVKNGLSHKPGSCPMRSAETLMRVAKKVLAEQLIKILPGYEKITMKDLKSFKKDKEGKRYRDKYGMLVLWMDVIVDIALRAIVPHIKKEKFDIK